MTFEWLYPRRCPVCMEIVMPKGGLVCKECSAKVPYIYGPRCYMCSKELEDEKQEYCYDCYCRLSRHLKAKTIFFDRCVAPLKYNSDMRRTMEKLKYNNKREYAEFFADSILRVYGELIKNWEADILMPVPIHRLRMIKRGYNQAALIAGFIKEYLDIECMEDILIRTKNTHVQNKLNDKERVKNVTGAFKIQKNVVQCKKVILVDDIYTTGSTINSCAKTLKEAGASHVYAVCACIGAGY